MRLPTVTQVLSPFADFSGIRPEVLAHAAERGTRVHQACAAIARGLWTVPPDDECRGYVQSFRGWFEQAVDEVVLVEAELVDEALGFKGHPDLICRIRGDERPSLIDLKTPATKNRLWRAQLAAYRHLARIHGYDVDRTASLRLKKDGGHPIFDEYDPRESSQDFAAFLSALNAYRCFKAA